MIYNKNHGDGFCLPADEGGGKPVRVAPYVAFAQITRSRISFGLIVAALSWFAPLHAQTTVGSVQGRISNAATGNSMYNARITVEGATNATLSNENGEYRLSNLPAGEVRLRVDYAGMRAQAATIRIAPAGVVQQDFVLSLAGTEAESYNDPVRMESFVVESTVLSAAAAALNEQKIAPNIKSVIVLEQIGDLGDGNIGEYLKYMPGLSIATAAFDLSPSSPGTVSIRGMPAAGVVFMEDGVQVSAPTSDRRFDLAITSAAASIDRVEVTKVPTPDLPANAIGGTVNIIGKSGFSNPRRELRINTYGTYNSYNQLAPPGLNENLGYDKKSSARAIQPGLDLRYIHPVNKSLVFTINLSDVKRIYDLDDDSPSWDLIRGVQTTSTLQNSIQNTERQLASVTGEWRINRQNGLQVKFEHIQVNTPTRQNIYKGVWDAANATGGATFTQGGPAGNDIVRQSVTWADRTRGTTLGRVRYLHEGTTYKFDASVSFSRSWDEREDVKHGFFRAIGTPQAGSLVLRADGLDGVYSHRAPVFVARTRTGQVFDPMDNAGFTLSNPTSQPVQNGADLASLAANLSREFALRVPTTLKAGFVVDRQRKDVESPLTTWTFSPPAGVSRLAGAYDLTNDTLSKPSFFSDTLNVKWLSPIKLYNLYQAHPEYFVRGDAAAHQSAVQNSKYFRETISAAFLRGDLKLLRNRLWLVGGVRFEHTGNDGMGPLNDLRATYKQDASGNLLRDAKGNLVPVTTDPIEKAKLQYTRRGAVASRKYSGYYPSINAAYYLTDSLVTRAGYAKTLQRPNLSSIIPGISVSDPGSAVRTATIVNSELNAWTADNYDVSLESYGLKGATIALSLYRKDMKNFFLRTQIPATSALLESFGLSDEYLDYVISTQKNGGVATAEGYEASWNQSLYFLPSWARGFSCYANTSISHITGENAADFTPIAHKTINWGMSYARRKLSLRFNVAYAYRVITSSAVATSATVPAGTVQYTAPQITQDFSFEYRFARPFTLYGGARNFNGAQKRTERAAPGAPAWTRPFSYQNFGTLVTLGVRTQF